MSCDYFFWIVANSGKTPKIPLEWRGLLGWKDTILPTHSYIAAKNNAGNVFENHSRRYLYLTYGLDKLLSFSVNSSISASTLVSSACFS
jgi:hypothetical protein